MGVLKKFILGMRLNGLGLCHQTFPMWVGTENEAIKVDKDGS